MAFSNPIVAGLELLIQAIQSPNFITGVSGWRIAKDGSAEFNNLVIRGTFFGADFIVNSSGIFFYNGTPAAGNLLISLASSAGTDSFGNVYPQGLDIMAAGKSVVMGLTGGAPLLYFVSGLAGITNGAALQDIILGSGTGQYEFLQILGAEESTHNDLMLMSLSSSSADGTAVPTHTVQYKDSGGTFHTLLTIISTLATLGIPLTVNAQVSVNRSTDSSAVNVTYTTTANATNAAFAYTAAGATGRLLSATVTGDTFGRFVVDANGTATWGTGSAARDTTLQRAAAGVLATLANFLIGSGTALGDNGVGELQLANAATVPTTNPTGGGVLYAKQGVPSFRDPGGHLLGMVRTYAARGTTLLSSFTTEADIPGATVSVVITGSNATIQVTANWDLNCGGAAATFVGFFNWNGVDQAAQGILTGSAANQRGTPGQNYVITGIAAGTYTAKLRASCTVSNSLNQAGGPHTGLSVLVIDQ